MAINSPALLRSTAIGTVAQLAMVIGATTRWRSRTCSPSWGWPFRSGPACCTRAGLSRSRAARPRSGARVPAEFARSSASWSRTGSVTCRRSFSRSARSALRPPARSAVCSAAGKGTLRRSSPHGQAGAALGTCSTNQGHRTRRHPSRRRFVAGSPRWGRHHCRVRGCAKISECGVAN